MRAHLVMLHGDYFGPYVRAVFLDAVHEVNMGIFSHCVPLLSVDLNDACLFLHFLLPPSGCKACN